MKYEFGRFQIDVSNRILSSEQEQIPLQARAFDCLLYLIEHAGQLVTKGEMMRAIWADSFVEESNLTVAISTIRRVLGEEQQNRRYIRTVPGRGYRFVCSVRELAQESSFDDLELLNGAARVQSSLPSWTDPVAATQVLDHTLLHSEEENRSDFPQVSFPLKILAYFIAILAAVAGAAALKNHYARPKLSSIAILPFTDEKKPQDDLSLLEMADALITDLDRELMIRPMSSVLEYSSDSSDPAAIGRQEGVDAVVTGTLSGNGGTSTMRLAVLRSSDGRVLWRREVSTKSQDPRDIQAAVRAALLEELHLFSIPSHKAQDSATEKPANTEAYQLYLRGRYFWSQRTEKSLERSIDYYKQSISIDPKFALAYAALADSYALQADLSIAPGKTCGPDARAAALAAIALDPQLAEPHAALGMVSFFSDWNGLEAEKEFQRAIALNPNYATAHHWYALDLAAMGRLPQALYEIRRAQALEPLSLIISTNVGWILYLNRDYERAIRQYAKVIELDPNFARARTRMGMAHMKDGDLPEALSNLEAAAKISDDDPYIIGLLAQAEGMSGRRDQANILLRQLNSRPESRYVPPVSRALVYIGLHKDEQALDELQQGFQDHSTALTYAKVDPSFDQLRNTARFQEMVSKIRF